jgi:hypothetical protein
MQVASSPDIGPQVDGRPFPSSMESFEDRDLGSVNSCIPCQHAVHTLSMSSKTCLNIHVPRRHRSIDSQSSAPAPLPPLHSLGCESKQNLQKINHLVTVQLTGGIIDSPQSTHSQSPCLRGSLVAARRRAMGECKSHWYMVDRCLLSTNVT